MAEPGLEPGRAWRGLALCGAAVFLAAAAAGGALVAWNLAASANRGPGCPEPGLNATAPPPGDPGPELQDLQRRLAKATERIKTLTGQLDQAEHGRRTLENDLKTYQTQQSQLRTELKTLKAELDEVKAQRTQMGAKNGALAEAVARWEAVAADSARRLDEAQLRAGAAEAQSGACAAREAALRERVKSLETGTGPRRQAPRPRTRPKSRTRSGSRGRPKQTGGCRRPLHTRASEPPAGWAVGAARTDPAETPRGPPS
ncbi:coiled-coil domain-containing protein 194 isoform X1 [Oryctolagus cuniculus]|uniref:coiled-coil domain-containing protein 194 isoform X1 n=1 Tax=Oryctolagus cuniculus TaxID=9986 RepID=UPI0038799475